MDVYVCSVKALVGLIKNNSLVLTYFIEEIKFKNQRRNLVFSVSIYNFNISSYTVLLRNDFISK